LETDDVAWSVYCTYFKASANTGGTLKVESARDFRSVVTLST